MKLFAKLYIVLVVLFILVLLFALYIHYHTKRQAQKIEGFETKQTIELIIARYNEDLKWTLDAPFNKFKYIVYNKGSNEDFEKSQVKKIIKLDNVGKCDHTYLYHIVNYYDNLQDINVFLPGSLNMANKVNMATQLLKHIIENKSAVFLGYETDSIKNKFSDFYLNSWKTSFDKNKDSNVPDELKPSDERPYGKWFEKKFGAINVKNYCIYGIFSVSKKDILQHTKDYYSDFVKDLNYPNPEVGHYIERSWGAIFHPFNDTKYIKLGS